MHPSFEDQSVVVSGASRGIGRAIAEAFLNAGARVYATYAGNEAAVAAMKADLAKSETGQAALERLSFHRFDVADGEAVAAFFKALPAPPQVVVCSAGIRKDQIVGMMLESDWQRVLDVNLTGSFLLAKQAVLAMSRERYGRIIFVTSPSGQLGFHGQANYAASKAGQVALAKSLSKEVGRRKITVNCVSPGFIDTELLSDLSDAHKQGFLDMVPLKRFGRPEEVAHAVTFLASKEAAYINGAVLEVTGGI